MSLLDKYEKKLKGLSLLERVTEKLALSGRIELQSTPSKTTNPFLFGKPDVTAFNKWAEFHRDHQQAAINAAVENDSGQIIIPTGTGKTRIQIHIHAADMIRKSDMNQTGVYVVGAHRLLLCAQLMDDLRDLCIRCKIPVNVLYVGSARHDDKMVYDRYFAHGITQDTFESHFTTTMEDILNFANKTKEQRRHLLIVSTYHSFDRLKVLDSIDVCTYDEAHTTVAEDFSENIFESVKPKIRRNYFFTATRRVRGKQFGMNDQERYGEILCAIPPREMITAGEIVTPRLHIMNLADDQMAFISDQNERMLIRTVTEGFKEHKVKLKEDSANPDRIGAKLLVSCKGSDELKVIQDSKVFKDWCESHNVKVYSFSSRFGSYENFEEEQNRTKVYESLRTLRDDEDAIFFHIDILTEGIDLPSITAVMLLRHLNTAKLMQTLGRALRLLVDDRIKLYGGQLTPGDHANYTKPFAYVMLPMHFEELNASAIEMKVMLRTIIAEYGLPTEQFLPSDRGAGKGEEERIPTVTGDGPGDERRRMDKEYPLLHLIQDFVMEKFGEGLPEDKLERYQAITELLKSLESKDTDAINSALFDEIAEDLTIETKGEELC